jgi:RNA polymerase sigma-54 factor
MSLRASQGPKAAPRLSQRLRFQLRVLATARRNMPLLLRDCMATGSGGDGSSAGMDWLEGSSTFASNLLHAITIDWDCSAVGRLILEDLVGNIGQQGYLELAPAEIALRGGTAPEAVEEVRRRLMDFEMRGIGCLDFHEFFLFQCRQGAASEPMVRAAPLLRAERRARRLIPVLRLLRRRLSAKLFAELLAHLADGRLRPHPRLADLWGDGSSTLGAPDLYFSLENGSWSVRSIPDADEPFFGGYPKMFRDAFARRQSLLRRIGEFLLDRQKTFFERGPSGAMALLQRDAADSLAVAPSTLSRAIRDKCVYTPYGLFPLREFFSRSEKASPIAINHCLGEIFRSDPATLLLSDCQLAAILAKQFNINLSRRSICDRRHHIS